MAADVPDKNLLQMLFEFYSPAKPLKIEDIEKLAIDDELAIVQTDRISSIQKRKQLTKSLYEKLPDLRQTAHKRIRFKSILSSYYKTYIELETMSPSQWTKTQLPLSLFIYLITELQKPDVNPKEKEPKNSNAAWKFIFFTLMYCNEESFDGQKLHLFYNEVTNNGTKTGGFGLKFVQKICNKYKLKFGKFAKVKKKVGIWYTDSLKKKTKKIISKTQVNDENKHDENKQHEGNKNDNKVVKPTPQHPPKPEFVPSGSKWYWMDMEELQWVPYTENDQNVLNQAYANKENRCNVVSGKFRVEFEVGSAAGNQFQNNVKDPINHMVVRAEPENGEIHGMACASAPKTY